MRGYVEKVLVEGEELLYRGNPSLWAYFWKLLLAGVLLVAGAVGAVLAAILSLLLVSLLGIVVLAAVFVSYKSTELAITNKRIIVKFGFIHRDTTEINLSKVESVQVQQSLLGRMLNFGTVVVAAGGGPMAPVPHIHAPLEFRKQFIMATDRRQG